MAIKVFIPAAGYGKRLRPITSSLPKPLLPLLGKPVIQTIVDRLHELPLQGIAVNTHYMSDKIEKWVKNSDYKNDIFLFHEKNILGTGGALKNAEAFLKGGTFLVHNSDIVSDIDMKELLKYHLSSDNLVTLATHDCEPFNNVILNKKGCFVGIGTGKSDNFHNMAFTGVAVYNDKFLDLLPKGISSVVNIWERAVKEGYKIGTFDVSGCFWSDTGTPSSFARTVFELLRREGEMVYAARDICDGKDVHANGYVVIEEGAKVRKDIYLRDCILLPRCLTESGHKYENAIIGPDYLIHLKESDIREYSEENRGFLVGAGGSDRRYYRRNEQQKSVILMTSGDKDPDFERHIEFTKFFRTCSIPVPELYSHDNSTKTAIFEDLGDLSIYNFFKIPRSIAETRGICKRVLDVTVMLHSIPLSDIDDCPALKERVFDYDHLRWETEYFFEKFVKSLKSVEFTKEKLERDFHNLAVKADNFTKTIIHRDFQSQNIMIPSPDSIKIIDYQGARAGPPAYDIASFLWDPYIYIDNRQRDFLLNYYIKAMREKNGSRFDDKEFLNTLIPCRLQRHMQALGAYAFLSLEKGKRYFLKHVPSALNMLTQEINEVKSDYPELYKLVKRL